MTAETLARATDNALRAAQLPAETIEGLRAAANSPHLLPDAGFHSATDIDSLDGLVGSYLWSEESLAVRVITFTFAPGQIGSAGDYQIKSGPAVFEEGSFQCVPSGPTSTVALLFLQPVAGPQRIFIIAGAFVDGTGEIVIMILADFNIAGLIVPRFSAVRLG
jgi:hypothetical protein